MVDLWDTFSVVLCINHAHLIMYRSYRTFPRLCVPLRPEHFRDVLQGSQGKKGQSKSDDCECSTDPAVGDTTAGPIIKRIR